ncbi:tetratricopeptide repeat protein [Streptomyces sp. Inha503]|uniref:tetratricopeptide repeat protein n=1 Tax=Streptomyces sp. Inha503 TaxID=3383314 RepID=UPI0039A2FDD0
MGEFLFRSYAPGLPERNGHRDTAAHEFGRALALDPGQERAAELSRYIATNLSPIGQPYNLDLMPDFPNFEDVVVDYDPIVHGRFIDAMNLLRSVLSTGQKRELLKTDMEQLAGMRDVLVLEEKAAGLALEGAEGRQKIINQQIEEVNQQIQQVREEMTRQRMQFPPGNGLGPLVGAAIAVAAYRVLAAANPAFETVMAKMLVFLGMYLQHAGRHEEAVTAGRDAVAVCRRHEDLPNLAWALSNLGALLQSAGRPGAGADAWREARDIYQRLDATVPGTYRPLLAIAAYRQAALLVADGRRAEALAAADRRWRCTRSWARPVPASTAPRPRRPGS